MTEMEALTTLFPQTPIVVMTPLWRADESTSYGVGSISAWRETIRKTAESYANVTVVNGEEMMDHDLKYLADGFVHPNNEGNQMVAERLEKK